MIRPLYRSRQVLHALRPRLHHHHIETLAMARDTLSEREFALFLSMEKRDQRHGLEVASRLRDASEASPDMLKAALLHDCGKGRAPVLLRIANVLSPGLVRGVARSEGNGWRAAAYRLAHHMELSAAAAETAGASEVAVRLIRGRPHATEVDIMSLLIAADDAS